MTKPNLRVVRNENERAELVLSEARGRLAELLDAKAEAHRDVEEARLRIERLETLARSAGPLEDEIRALDATETAAMATRVHGEDGELPPVADNEKRADIKRRLTEARASAAAAERAQAEVAAHMRDAHARAASAEQGLALHIPKVLLEYGPDLISDLRDAGAALAEKARRLDTLQSHLYSLARALPEGPARQRLFLRLKTFAREVRDAHQRPPSSCEDEATACGEWASLAARLQNDATAKLENGAE
jgi:predicted  nucleic acid-binding Zn-ribbon protein